jgi:hypothetical protein
MKKHINRKEERIEKKKIKKTGMCLGCSLLSDRLGHTEEFL